MRAISLHKAIFLDPADYEVGPDRRADAVSTKSGHDTEPFEPSTAASLLTDLESDCKVDVIHLSIRNYTPSGYVASGERGTDHEGLYPRLSTEMVKAFYEYTPIKNRGQYFEVNEVPHAFNRDGSRKRNIEILTELIAPLL